MSLERKIINFLKGPKKGETYELKSGLVSQYKLERKDAIQRVIQAMTVGKDVSALFPDVLKNIATYDIEQKKLVYLYLMNYAKLHPELCILAVNTFVQDTEDPNPLIKALAIRTMGCIRVDKMVDYMEIPLRRTLHDDNPYVRKTAAICVAKLFDLSPEMCVEYGFLDDLKKLLADLNPMVVANALNALFEIRDMNTDPSLAVLSIDKNLTTVLLACLNECTEWGRITILSTLCEYTPESADEALHIVERSVPQLQHANPSVVLAAIKVVLRHTEYLNQAQKTAFLRKLSAPLVSLASLPIPEAQYVGLRNIRIILEKHPSVLSRELRVFFIKYSDPLYLKLEKLEIVIRLACDANSALLLGELKEYAMEIEPMLVSRAIRAIGAVAIKLAASVIPAVNILISLIEQRGGDLVVGESVSVLSQILRRYPGKNDLVTLVVPVISNHINELEDAAALSAYVFLLGEYPKYFTSLKDKLRVLVDAFLEHEPQVQLNVLTAVVKVSLALPDSGVSPLLQSVLDKATTECDNADVRDKAYIYWRLLSSSSTDAQQKVILARLPPIQSVISSFNPAVLNALMNELSTLSSVYLKPASTFIDASVSHAGRKPSTDMKQLTNLAKQEIINNARNENLLNLDDDDEPEQPASTSILDDLNDLFAVPAASSGSNKAQSSTNDILSLFGSSTNENSVSLGLEGLNLGLEQPQQLQLSSLKPSADLLDLL